MVNGKPQLVKTNRQAAKCAKDETDSGSSLPWRSWRLGGFYLPLTPEKH
jgi:hypothetical protein